MGSMYGVPGNDFAGFGSHASRWVSRVLGYPWQFLKWLFTLVFTTGLFGVGGVLGYLGVILAWAFRALLATPFVWYGWNHGLAPTFQCAQVTWETAFWISVAAVPFAGSSK